MKKSNLETMKADTDFMKATQKDPHLLEKTMEFWDNEFINIQNKNIPEMDRQEEYGSLMSKIPSLVGFSARQTYIGNNSWAVPTREAIDAIKSFLDKDNVLSIGSGLGLWEKLLFEQGVDITASDVNIANSVPPSIFVDKSKLTAPVVSKMPQDRYWNMDHKSAISKFMSLYYDNPMSLFMCWPSYMSNHAYESVDLLGPEKVVYVGEGKSWSCANDNFFDILGKKYDLIQIIEIPQWYGIYDTVCLYKRKSP
jgi:hypothetical protein